jgi:glycosyltransferase involved in cell wall biosynthesis
MPLISIIVPVYKVEPYLRGCLDSLVNQTYRNLEIILVDDGSPDRSGEICDEYASADKRIIVIHQENKGVSESRNAALNTAHGDYFLFVDSDDWLEKNTCETALHIAEEQHADIVVFGIKVHFLSGEMRNIGTGRCGPIDKCAMMGQLVDIDIMSSLLNKLYSRGLFDGIRLIQGRYCEDMDIMYKIIHRSQAIYLTDSILYHYCHREGSLTTQRYQAKAIKSRVLIFKERLAFIQQHYPEYADKQAALLMRELLLGREWLKGDLEYPAFMDEYRLFFKEYHSKIKDLKQFNRLIGLYYYCRPLALLYEKGRHLLYQMGYKNVLK